MSQDQTSKLETLVDRLQAQTDSASLQWELADRGQTFVAVLRGGSVEISGQDDMFFLTVRNDDGDDLESFTAHPPPEPRLGLINMPLTPVRPLDTKLPRLHTTVRRLVMKVDATLDALIDQLGT